MKTFLETVLEALEEMGCRRVIVRPITPRGIYGGGWGEHCPHCHVQTGEQHLLGCRFATFPEDEPAREVVLKHPEMIR